MYKMQPLRKLRPKNRKQRLAIAKEKGLGKAKQKIHVKFRFPESQSNLWNLCAPPSSSTKFRRESTTVKWLHVFTLSFASALTCLAVSSTVSSMYRSVTRKSEDPASTWKQFGKSYAPFEPALKAYTIFPAKGPMKMFLGNVICSQICSSKEASLRSKIFAGNYFHYISISSRRNTKQLADSDLGNMQTKYLISVEAKLIERRISFSIVIEQPQQNEKTLRRRIETISSTPHLTDLIRS